jgi:DNA-binding CsgD family transcriptional regulator
MSKSATYRDSIKDLILAVTGIEHQSAELGTRRISILGCIAKLTGAEAGFWGWGRGNPVETTIAPVVGIPFGFTPAEWPVIMEASLDEDGRNFFARLIADRLRVDSHVSVSRSMLYTDSQWHDLPSYRRHLAPIGWDDWMTSVLYLADDTWSCLTLFRKVGRPAFQAAELELLDIALGGIRWLHPRISESIPPMAFIDLTARQRIVMLYLLDGLSRKQIAVALGVSLHTVNDHVKALYDRFEVHSATELTARFLKSH